MTQDMTRDVTPGRRRPWRWVVAGLAGLLLAYGAWIVAELDDVQEDRARIERYSD